MELGIGVLIAIVAVLLISQGAYVYTLRKRSAPVPVEDDDLGARYQSVRYRQHDGHKHSYNHFRSSGYWYCEYCGNKTRKPKG